MPITVLKKLFCIAGLLFLLPILVVSAIMILFEDGMPILFRQIRIGLNQNKFVIYKLRTMKKNTPNVGTHEIDSSFNLKCGSLLRSIKLDEFPQLINVIKGDLNLIGPRPCLENQLDLIKHRSKQSIFSIKPGVTGLAQVMGYDMSDPEKLAKVDKIYIKNKNWFIDGLIFFATFINLPKKYLSKKLNIAILKNE